MNIKNKKYIYRYLKFYNKIHLFQYHKLFHIYHPPCQFLFLSYFGYPSSALFLNTSSSKGESLVKGQKKCLITIYFIVSFCLISNLRGPHYR